MIKWFVVVVLLLLIPFIAMQFTKEVMWDGVDFIITGSLLLGSAFMYELVTKKSSTTAHKVAVGMAVAAALFLVWINLAVGVIGNENNSLNLLYVGVLAVGFVGTLMAGLKPQGMARALFATAVAQALVPIIALIFWSDRVTLEPQGIVGVFILNAFFVLMFTGSGVLFRRAGRRI